MKYMFIGHRVINDVCTSLIKFWDIFFTSSFSAEFFPGGKISIYMNFVVGDFNKQMQKLNINNCQPCSVYTNSRDLSILLK